jgi:hypothetical protein
VLHVGVMLCYVVLYYVGMGWGYVSTACVVMPKSRWVIDHECRDGERERKNLKSGDAYRACLYV